MTITRGRARRLTRSVEGAVYLIGASGDCDLVIGDPLFPGTHSYILVTSAGVRLRHLGHPPDVLVDGQQVVLAELHDGSEIAIGPFTFQVHVDWSRDDDAAPPTRRASRYQLV